MSSERGETVDRRWLLGVAFSGAAASLAGCLGEDDSDASDGETDESAPVDENDSGEGEEQSESSESDPDQAIQTDPAEIVSVIPESILPSSAENYAIGYYSIEGIDDSVETNPYVKALHEVFLLYINDGGSDLNFEEEKINTAWSIDGLPYGEDSPFNYVPPVVYSGDFDTERIKQNHEFLREVVTENNNFEIIEAGGLPTEVDARWALREDYLISSDAEKITSPTEVIAGNKQPTELPESVQDFIQETPSDIFIFYRNAQGGSIVPFTHMVTGTEIQDEKLVWINRYRTDDPDEIVDIIESGDTELITDIITEDRLSSAGDNETLSLETTGNTVEHRIKLVDIEEFATFPFNIFTFLNPI